MDCDHSACTWDIVQANNILYVNPPFCYDKLQVFTLPFVLSSGALLYQVRGCYKVPVQVPYFFSEEVVQNHCRHR
jgi:hypothetical protein